MKILITGFDPFGGETINPASEAVRLVRAPAGVELIRMPDIPTVFSVSKLVCSEILKGKPDAVLCIGQAGGRRAVTPERIGINLMDAGIPDNRGFQPKDLPIEKLGKAAYFSTLPVKKIAEAITLEGIPCEISNSAGTFVCNSLLYSVLSFIEKEQLPIRAGFLHVPFLPSQTVKKPGYPSLPMEQIVAALEIALKVIAKT